MGTGGGPGGSREGRETLADEARPDVALLHHRLEGIAAGPGKVSSLIHYNIYMTRSELILALAHRFPQLTQKDAELSVKEILDGIITSLTVGGRVEIRGFGSFALNYRPSRTARNPKTGVPVQVPGKWVPHFKPGKELREKVTAVAVVEALPLKMAA